MAELTICEALKELKTLDARINKLTQESVFTAVSVGGKAPVGYKSEEEFRTRASGNLQAIRALISRRNSIKSAIVESNAKTTVAIGGNTYTVAGAIERKASIQYEQKLVRTLGFQLLKSLKEMENVNDQVKRQLDVHISTILGKDAKEKNAEEFENFTAKYMAKNEAKIVDPVNAKAEIDNMELSIESFLANVDTQLSISNATTKITVAD